MVCARAQKAEVSTEQRAPLYRKDVRGPRAIGESGEEGVGQRLAERQKPWKKTCRRRWRNRRRKPRHTPVGLFIVTRTYGDRFRNQGIAAGPAPGKGFHGEAWATIHNTQVYSTAYKYGFLGASSTGRARMDPRDTAIIHKDYPPCSTHTEYVGREGGGEGPIWPVNRPGIRPTKSACETVRRFALQRPIINNSPPPLSGKESRGGLMILISPLINLGLELYSLSRPRRILGGSVRIELIG